LGHPCRNRAKTQYLQISVASVDFTSDGEISQEDPFASKKHRARFEGEVQILAALDYPNIVSASVEDGTLRCWTS
jgi:hypothetical protein